MHSMNGVREGWMDGKRGARMENQQGNCWMGGGKKGWMDTCTKGRKGRNQEGTKGTRDEDGKDRHLLPSLTFSSLSSFLLNAFLISSSIGCCLCIGIRTPVRPSLKESATRQTAAAAGGSVRG
mmetsp:Transcript_27000/g.52974  ORF Transcript_27000/g.52974 Transcript_27000/m.52974 type:complete len:123 (-) Transcript_27000:104-472(-)